MEGAELIAESQGSAEAHRNDDDAEMHEDAEFSDLPVHFQPVEDGGNDAAGPAPPPVSESVMEPQPRSKPKLMDASTQYFDKSIMLTPKYPDPPQGKVDSSCQYSPTDIGYMCPTPSIGSYGNTTGDSGLYGFSNSSGHINPMGYAGLYGFGPAGHCNVSGKGYEYGPSSTSGDICGAVNSGVHRLSSPGSQLSSEHNGMSGDTQLSSECNGMSGGGRMSNEHNGLSGGGQLRSEHKDNVSGGSQMRGEYNMSGEGQLRGEHNNLSGGGQLKSEQNGVSSGSQLKSEHTSTSSSGHLVKPYQCPECNASFTRVDHLSRHLKTQRSHFQNAMAEKSPGQSQSPAQYHACPQCSKLFTRRDHMKRHSKIHSRGEPVKCVECQMWFPAKAQLSRHLLDAHNVQVFECSHCSKGFFHPEYLTRHLREKHSMTPNGKMTASPQALLRPYRCGICSLQFRGESECNRHMSLHSRPDRDPAASLPLAPSQRAGVSSASAVSHSLSQMWSYLHSQSNEDFSCNMNGFAMPPFSQSQSLPGQIAPSVSNSMMMQSFSHPKDMFASEAVKTEPFDGDCVTNSGTSHVRNKDKVQGSDDNKGGHAGHCGKTLDHLSRLQLPHHTGKQPFLCGVCGAGYLRAQQLKMHLRKHTGLRPFSCVECGASFASSSNLIRHQRTHSGEKPYKCNQCTGAFTHKGALINHERIHSGQRPYECDLCGAAFARCDALSRHKKTHKENRIKQEEESGSSDLFGLQS